MAGARRQSPRATLDHVVLEVRDPVRSAAFGARGRGSPDPHGITLEARFYPARG